MKLCLKPWQKVILAMILGVVVGLCLKEDAKIFEPLGIVFMSLIKMIIAPLIFFTLIYGITNIDGSSNLKRIGIKAVFVFISTSVFAVLIGMSMSLIIGPGIGKKILLMDMDSIYEIKGIAENSVLNMLIDIIPVNAIKSLSEGNILQIIILAFFVGFSLNAMREKCQSVIKLCQESAILLMKMIEYIMKLAPIGVFGYISYIVGSQGLEVMHALGKLIITIFLACFVQYLMFGVIIFLWARLSPIPFYKKMIEPQVIAFSTSSSKATLTTLMKICEERLGISSQKTKFLVPLASALNMDGGAIYQGACAIFFAQMFGVDLNFAQYLTLIFMCTVASIGGAGIPGGVLLFLGMVLTSVGLPIEGVILIVSIDRILDMVTTMVNITGDACVALLVDRSENTFDEKKYYDF